jgi:flagellar basal-body rod modification protein FlgD
MQVGSPFQSQTNANTTASKISSDFETFLKMLTAQISNQDPLNPIDASDYST